MIQRYEEEENLDKVIKTQAVVRGNQARNMVGRMKESAQPFKDSSLDGHETGSFAGGHSVAGRVKKPPITMPTGAVYEGEWRDNKRDGYGIQSWPDGSKYIGQWENDKANGHGKLYHADGDVYDGQWVDDKAQGQGNYIH